MIIGQLLEPEARQDSCHVVVEMVMDLGTHVKELR